MSIALSENEVEKIYDLGKRGREAWQSGNIQLAENLFQSAWNVLPASKFECDYSQSLSSGMTVFYRDTRQFQKAYEWLDITRKAYGPEWNPSVEFLGATVHFEAGDLDRAFEVFDLLFKKYGKRPFEGEPPQYLDFYRQRAQGEQTEPSEDIHEQIEVLSAEGNELCDQSRFEEAIEKWTSALNLLPEPKTDWDAYTWLSASIGDVQYQLNRFDLARHSLLDALNGPDGQDNPFIYYRLGQSLIRLGEEEQGVQNLLKAYMLDGEQIFSAEPDGASYLQKLRDRNLIG